jgi:hypothetical protein
MARMLLIRNLVCVGTVGMLAACGAPAQFGPSATASSWAAPDKKSSVLVYISDENAKNVRILSYPKLTPIRDLSGFTKPIGECVDSAGDVFVVDAGSAAVYEFAHGGSAPINTLSDPGYAPSDCSVDPSTGDVAVSNWDNGSGAKGNVAVYKAGKKKPEAYYSDAKLSYPIACTYDDRGNLYVDGYNGAGSKKYGFAELAKGSTSLTTIKVHAPIEQGAGLLWDGTYVAVEDEHSDTIYRLAVRGKKADLAGVTPLTRSTAVAYFWVYKGSVVAADFGASEIGVWNYPRGGIPERTEAGFVDPMGVAISARE